MNINKNRDDIGFLRAVAVTAVVLFHFQINGFSGGYIGVDVFFVISGFLMTKIIVSKLYVNDFNLFDFLIRRAKRIIPALFFLTVILIIFGWFYLLPADYVILTKSVISSNLFISNFYFLNQPGYFSPSAHENLLLHTWSLSAEWQFYIIYPILLMGCFRYFAFKTVRLFILILTLFSLFLSVTLSSLYPNLSYYMLHTRGWEMLAGGVVFLYPLNKTSKTSNLTLIVSLVLIFVPIFAFTSENVWPGYLALLPVVGSMLLLWGSNSSIMFFKFGFFQYLGKISYSFYLWHWPIVAYLIYIDKLEIIEYKALGIVASILIASLSYYFIEKYFLQKNKFFTKKTVISFCFCAFIPFCC